MEPPGGASKLQLRNIDEIEDFDTFFDTFGAHERPSLTKKPSLPKETPLSHSDSLDTPRIKNDLRSLKASRTIDSTLGPSSHRQRVRWAGETSGESPIGCSTGSLEHGGDSGLGEAEWRSGNQSREDRYPFYAKPSIHSKASGVQSLGVGSSTLEHSNYQSFTGGSTFETDASMEQPPANPNGQLSRHQYPDKRKLSPARFQLPQQAEYSFRTQMHRLKGVWPKRWISEWFIVQYGVLLICAKEEPFLVKICIPLKNIQEIRVVPKSARFGAAGNVFTMQHIHPNKKGNASFSNIICKTTTAGEAQHAVQTLTRLRNNVLQMGPSWDDLVDRRQAELVLQSLHDSVRDNGIRQVIRRIDKVFIDNGEQLSKEVFSILRSNCEERKKKEERINYERYMKKAEDAVEETKMEIQKQLTAGQHALFLKQLVEVIQCAEMRVKNEALIAWRKRTQEKGLDLKFRAVTDVLTQATVISRELVANQLVQGRNLRFGNCLEGLLKSRLHESFNLFRLNSQIWRLTVQGRRRAIMSLLRFRETSQRALTSRHMYRWKLTTNILARQEEALKRVLTGLKQWQCHTAFSQWTAGCIMKTQKNKQAIERLADVLNKFFLRLKSFGLHSWRLTVSEVGQYEAYQSAANLSIVNDKILFTELNTVPRERGCYKLEQLIKNLQTQRVFQCLHELRGHALKRKFVPRNISIAVTILSKAYDRQMLWGFSNLLKHSFRSYYASSRRLLGLLHMCVVLRVLIGHRCMAAFATFLWSTSPWRQGQLVAPEKSILASRVGSFPVEIKPIKVSPTLETRKKAIEALSKIATRVSATRCCFAFEIMRAHTYRIETLRGIARSECLLNVAHIFEKQLFISLSTAFTRLRCSNSLLTKISVAESEPNKRSAAALDIRRESSKDLTWQELESAQRQFSEIEKVEKDMKLSKLLDTAIHGAQDTENDTVSITTQGDYPAYDLTFNSMVASHNYYSMHPRRQHPYILKLSLKKPKNLKFVPLKKAEKFLIARPTRKKLLSINTTSEGTLSTASSITFSIADSNRSPNNKTNMLSSASPYTPSLVKKVLTSSKCTATNASPSFVPTTADAGYVVPFRPASHTLETLVPPLREVSILDDIDLSIPRLGGNNNNSNTPISTLHYNDLGTNKREHQNGQSSKKEPETGYRYKTLLSYRSSPPLVASSSPLGIETTKASLRSTQFGGLRSSSHSSVQSVLSSPSSTSSFAALPTIFTGYRSDDNSILAKLNEILDSNTRRIITSTGESPDIDITRDFVFDDLAAIRAPNDVDFLTHLEDAERILNRQLEQSLLQSGYSVTLAGDQNRAKGTQIKNNKKVPQLNGPLEETIRSSGRQNTSPHSTNSNKRSSTSSHKVYRAQVLSQDAIEHMLELGSDHANLVGEKDKPYDESQPAVRRTPSQIQLMVAETGSNVADLTVIRSDNQDASAKVRHHHHHHHRTKENISNFKTSHHIHRRQHKHSDEKSTDYSAVVPF